MSRRSAASRARRIVVKVGSSVLTDNGTLRPRVFTRIAAQIAQLLENRREVVLVSSGAIALGTRNLGWKDPGPSIPEKQAAAAVGQPRLMELYQRRFARHGRLVGQVLVTRAGLEDRERFLNARRTLQGLLSLGVVPVVNENDTIATDEIRFGDNDNLSATVVNLVGADLLVLLTDVEGLHHRRPESAGPPPPLFDVVEKITPEVERAAGGSGTAFGRGGMITKIEAARTAAHSGAATVVCNGRLPNVLLRVTAGEPVGTLLLSGDRLASRKHWLAYTTRPRGRIVIDEGGVRALCERGRSLLPAGIVRVEGSFRIGDAVSCSNESGQEFARGLTAYGSEEVTRIRGLPTREVARVLGYSNGDEVIHRDDLVLVGKTSSEPEAGSPPRGPR